MSNALPEVVSPSRPVPSLADDVRAGLLRVPRELPPKYFYDDRGSALFEAICETPEYYPTRAEKALIAAHAAEVIEASRPQFIIELGSGVASKIGPLFAACEALNLPTVYCPFDVCEAVLIKTAALLSGQFNALEVRPLLGDFTAGLEHLPRLEGRTLYMFLGGTIGNFTDPAAISLLSEIRALMGPEDRLLLGADRVKDVAKLNAAYNDAAGYTAAFNLNVLSVLNEAIDADFEPEKFSHRAFYNQNEAQIEMHLESRVEQLVTLGDLGQTLHLASGETIRTEISRKFCSQSIARLMSAAGFQIEQHHSGPEGEFSLLLASPADA